MVRGKRLRRIAAVYYQACYARTLRWNKFSIVGALRLMTEEQRVDFNEAASISGRLNAKPLEYVIAQFAPFDEVSASRGRLILPKPHHLHGPKAELRWEQRDNHKGVRSCAEEIVNTRRRVPGSEGDIFDVEEQVKEFFRDQRKLDNLSVMLKLEPIEVMRRHPAEFSRAFLAKEGAL